MMAGSGEPGRTEFDPRQRQGIFPLAFVSRPALKPTQPPIQWVLGVLYPRVKRGWSVTLTTHLIYCRSQELVGTICPLPLGTYMA
jgi:hypothetical protein